MAKTNRSKTAVKCQKDECFKRPYGKNAIVTQLGQVNIVHLDRPSKETIRKRIEEVIREEIAGEAFFDDCPLCREFQKHPYDIVYYRQD
jgi:hypothetical protein